jgi:hypothetical protein
VVVPHDHPQRRRAGPLRDLHDHVVLAVDDAVLGQRLRRDRSRLREVGHPHGPGERSRIGRLLELADAHVPAGEVDPERGEGEQRDEQQRRQDDGDPLVAPAASAAGSPSGRGAHQPARSGWIR